MKNARKVKTMRHANRWLWVALAVAAAPFSGCGGETAAHEKIEPAQVEHIEGSEFSRVTLTEKAIQRLAVETAPVREEKVSRSETPQRVVPYAALLYGEQGETWVYTSAEPRVFQRHKVDVDYIEGDQVVLKDGPPTGTEVATVGVAELYGTEFPVGH